MKKVGTQSLQSKQTLSWLLLWAFCKGSAGFFAGLKLVLWKNCTAPRQPAQTPKDGFSLVRWPSKVQPGTAASTLLQGLLAPTAEDSSGFPGLGRCCVATQVTGPDVMLWGKVMRPGIRWPQTGTSCSQPLNSSCGFWHQLSAMITRCRCSNAVKPEELPAIGGMRDFLYRFGFF